MFSEIKIKFLLMENIYRYFKRKLINLVQHQIDGKNRFI